MTMHATRERDCGRAGFVLLATAAFIIVAIALLGMAVDVGRMYVVKSELQTYSDAAAIAAAYALDGTRQGITNASAAIQNVTGSPSASNRWNFATQNVTSAQIGFSTSATGPFVSSPATAPGVIFARVTAAQPIPMYFLPILPSVAGSQTVTATSVAGQLARNSLGNGLSPFSPDAHNTADPNFGFTVGQFYTLRWPPSGQGSKRCTGDAGYTPVGSSDRGYVDIGQGSGNSSTVSAVVDNNFNLTAPLAPGSSISMLTGQGSVSAAMQTRFNEDTDTTSATFATYTGNGRRVLIVPVNDGSATPTVVGFGAFFLPPNACGTKNTDSCCGEYIGAGLAFANHQAAATGAGLYQAKLAQ